MPMKLLRDFSSNKLILIDAKSPRKLEIVTIFYATLQSFNCFLKFFIICILD